jgi:hypothetical protein
MKESEVELLFKQAKTYIEVKFSVWNDYHKRNRESPISPAREWLSVDVVKAFLADKIVVDRKQLEEWKKTEEDNFETAKSSIDVTNVRDMAMSYANGRIKLLNRLLGKDRFSGEQKP